MFFLDTHLIGLQDSIIKAGKIPTSIQDIALQAGDILSFRNYRSGYGERTNYYRQDSIISANIVTDTLFITFHSKNYDANGVITSDKVLTITYTQSWFDDFFLLPSNTADLRDKYHSDYIGSFGLDFRFGDTSYTKTFYDGYMGFYNCEYSRVYDGGHPSYYNSKIGYMGYSICGVAECTSLQLIGYKLGNKTYGRINLSLEALAKQQIKIYPNPATNEINVSLNKSFTYSINNLSGKTLATGISENKIDVSHLSKGMYILQINDSYLKFVKQ